MYKIEPLSIIGYELSELSEIAMERALLDEAKFLIEVDGGERFPEALKIVEENNTPWFFTHEVMEMYRDEIIEVIEMNEYLFNEEGYMLPLQRCCIDNKPIKTIMNIPHFGSIEVKLTKIFTTI